MTDFKAARRNMVDCQIRTNGVIDERILDAFLTIPRELFVPAAKAPIAYNDEDIPLGSGRVVLEPAVHARMIQALELTGNCVVMDIGGGSGYSAAILSSLASTVVAIETEQGVIDAATKLWHQLDCCNIAGLTGALAEGNPEHAPYEAILMNGAVTEIPQKLVRQLTPGGRLVAVVKKPGEVMGSVTLVRHSAEGQYSAYPLFNAGTPYLEGFAPEPAFQF